MSATQSYPQNDAPGAISSEQPQPEEILLDVQHLSKRFPVVSSRLSKSRDYIHAVSDVSFQIKKGEAFGLVGESGCGKTTIGKILVNLYRASAGAIFYKGVDLAALKPKERKKYHRDIQMIFQDPYSSLNPRMKVGDIIAEPIITNKLMPAAEVEDRVDNLLECVGLANYARNRYPHEFSGGQRQRIGIARALAMDPKLIICDEPVSALDVSIQAQVLNLLDDLKKEFGLTYLFIAHGLNVIKHVSDKVGVMYLGKMLEVASKEELFANPCSPYTQALLSAAPVIDPAKKRERIILEGEVTSPLNPPEGCRFSNRCFKKIDLCDGQEPPLVEIGENHFCACHLYAKNLI